MSFNIILTTFTNRGLAPVEDDAKCLKKKIQSLIFFPSELCFGEKKSNYCYFIQILITFNLSRRGFVLACM